MAIRSNPQSFHKGGVSHDQVRRLVQRVKVGHEIVEAGRGTSC